ncbi:3-oxoacyl-[acyl-carrier-protein] reductase [Glutamicibacter endophyticus]|uniref:SDR family oxidoreductase n=1 Tax=Glutamicibacter sp. PS TaxID=3075634 RepID=UPI002843F782|nr:SDR family oxidoreductase [Glutamicibacter sp. PS]MDR4533951.1 SDR family oxidoreductase [Glutamicibacter sp. PS]
MSNCTWNFEGKIAVITGAAGGIGGVLAELLAQAGASVVLADLDRDALDDSAKRLEAQGHDVLAMQVNAADAQSIDALIAQVRERYGRIDFLVPSAGIYPESSVAEMPDDQWRRVQSINLEGVFLLIKRAIPLLVEGSAIVNLTSVAGHRGSRNHAHYAASKGGLIALTRTLALELGPQRIRVNAVSPGIIDTAMTTEARASHGEQWVAATPLGRDGSAQEVADVIAFLLSDAASFVHGEVIHANGGLFMAG